MLFAGTFAVAFVWQCVGHKPNFTLLVFALFLIVGAVGNRDKSARYARMDFSCKDALQRGVEIRRVAISAACPIKNALRFLSRGSYLILEVYDEEENCLFDLPQNELSACFLSAKSPHTPLAELCKMDKERQQKDEKVG